MAHSVHMSQPCWSIDYVKWSHCRRRWPSHEARVEVTFRVGPMSFYTDRFCAYSHYLHIQPGESHVAVAAAKLHKCSLNLSIRNIACKNVAKLFAEICFFADFANCFHHVLQVLPDVGNNRWNIEITRNMLHRTWNISVKNTVIMTQPM